HTRSKRDWSSDVCSSDLPHNAPILIMKHSYLSILKVSIGKVYIRMLKSYGAYFFQFPHSSKSMMLFDRKTKQSPKNNRTHKSCIEDRKSTRLNSSHVSISYAVYLYIHSLSLHDALPILHPSLS